MLMPIDEALASFDAADDETSRDSSQ